MKFKVYPNYDRIAYDYDYSYLSEECIRENKDILDVLRRYVKEGDEVLDVGCGTGFGRELLISRDIRYVGVDTSRKMISRAVIKFPNDTFIMGEPDDFEGHYDVILTLFSIPYMGLDGMKKFLAKGRKGATVIAVFYDTPYNNPSSVYKGHEDIYESERRPQVNQIVDYIKMDTLVREAGPIGSLGAYRYLVATI